MRKAIIDSLEKDKRATVGGFVDDYFDRLGQSYYCLVPRGASSWTNHLYESFFAGCVPVILSDDFELPFQSFINWESMSLKVNESMIVDGKGVELVDSLEKNVRTKSTEIYAQKTMMAEARCWFDYHDIQGAAECSPYLGLLKELEARKSKTLGKDEL